MKIKAENLNDIAMSDYELHVPQGAISKIATQVSLSTKSVSRALKADHKNVSHVNAVSIRLIALRDYDAYPIKTTKVKA